MCCHQRWIPAALVLLSLTSLLRSEEQAGDLATRLRELDAVVIPADQAKEKQLDQMVYRDVRRRLYAANERETAAWEAIKTKADWEAYREKKLLALRGSLGQYPAAPADLKVRVTGTRRGEGYRIENLVFESRPGLLVTANLYLPTDPPKSMPGIIICHSHHNPKTQSELQDMGMLWARLGCMVLVPDQLGHGERRQHPFLNEKSFSGTFRAGRQDYYFRYNTGMQLHLLGDSLAGWMAYDMMRCVDLLLGRPGIDKERIVLLGSVAGGGDPTAVTAALDSRIAAVAPFNFGGPQPETTYPLPTDSSKWFNYAGSGSWESTRSLRLSARDGFMPWVIVGSVAPRRLIYAHEFAWDRERDPVWARFEKLWSLYNQGDRLSFAHGRGKVTGMPPESTHCNNIGVEHRKPMYPVLKRWFEIAEPTQENQERRPSDELICLTPEALKEIKPRSLSELATELGTERVTAARQKKAGLTNDLIRQRLRVEWNRLLGGILPTGTPKAISSSTQQSDGVTIEKLVLEVEPQLLVPVVLLTPPRKGDARLPVVVAVGQHGKQEFLKQRSEMIAEMLRQGVAVCLPDLRGIGETKLGDSRGRSSSSTSISATELMLGQTMVGARLRDLRGLLMYLRERKEIDPASVALWGDSFAPVNTAERNLAAPLDADKLPDHAEPLGGLLALFATLFDDKIKAVYIHGGLTGFHSVLQSPFVYIPHDAVVPGALTTGDLADVVAVLAPRPIRLEGLVDGQNRRVAVADAGKTYQIARDAYKAAPDRLSIVESDRAPHRAAANWIVSQIKNK